jgi:hypothetical protein
MEKKSLAAKRSAQILIEIKFPESRFCSWGMTSNTLLRGTSARSVRKSSAASLLSPSSPRPGERPGEHSAARRKYGQRFRSGLALADKVYSVGMAGGIGALALNPELSKTTAPDVAKDMQTLADQGARAVGTGPVGAIRPGFPKGEIMRLRTSGNKRVGICPDPSGDPSAFKFATASASNVGSDAQSPTLTP